VARQRGLLGVQLSGEAALGGLALGVLVVGSAIGALAMTQVAECVGRVRGAALHTPQQRYCTRACPQQAYRLRHRRPARLDVTMLRSELKQRRQLIEHTVYECLPAKTRPLGQQTAWSATRSPASSDWEAIARSAMRSSYWQTFRRGGAGTPLTRTDRWLDAPVWLQSPWSLRVPGSLFRRRPGSSLRRRQQR
jgi:hypothetical protein